MKKIIYLFVIAVAFACSPTERSEEEIPLGETDVRIEFFTTQKTYDEIQFSYYVNGEDVFKTETLVFNYDSSGNPLPKVINWDNFGFKYVRGEAYRNNFAPQELTIKLYINDKLVFEETSLGNANAYARVTFDYTID